MKVTWPIFVKRNYVQIPLQTPSSPHRHYQHQYLCIFSASKILLPMANRIIKFGASLDCSQTSTKRIPQHTPKYTAPKSKTRSFKWQRSRDHHSIMGEILSQTTKANMERIQSRYSPPSPGGVYEHIYKFQALQVETRCALRVLAKRLLRYSSRRTVSLGNSLGFSLQNDDICLSETLDAIRSYFQVNDLQLLSNNSLEYMYESTRIHYREPFKHALNSMGSVIKCLEQTKTFSPNSHLLMALQHGRTLRSNPGGRALTVIPLLKNLTRQYAVQCEGLTRYLISHHKNIFVQEYQLATTDLWEFFYLLRQIIRLCREWRDLVYRNSNFTAEKNQHVIGLRQHISLGVLANVHAKKALREYMKCVHSRLTFYQEMSEKHPEDLPLINSQLHIQALRRSRVLGTTQPRCPSLQAIKINIAKQEYILRQMTIDLLKLLEYYDQFEKPGQQQEIKPLQYFLSKLAFEGVRMVAI